jgi:hypothetical protein
MINLYAKDTVPVPAVSEVILKAPEVAVDPVSPLPIVIVLVFGYLRITIPDPPAEFAALLDPAFLSFPPPPPPVLVCPGVFAYPTLPPCPPPPVPPVAFTALLVELYAPPPPPPA